MGTLGTNGVSDPSATRGPPVTLFTAVAELSCPIEAEKVTTFTSSLAAFKSADSTLAL